MWSFCVQFLDDFGKVIKSAYVSASSPRHAEREAFRAGAVPPEFADIEVTRLN